MLFSDELLEIGRKSNKNSNLSMNIAVREIMQKIQGAYLPADRENCTIKYVFSTLNKEGYKYFGEVLKQASADTRLVNKL